MERNIGSASLVGADELMLLNSEVSSFIVENGGNIFRRLANVNPDDRTAWTDEKHNLYLSHLEVSFVTQLQEARVNKNITQKQPINSPEQYGCWQNIDHRRDEPLSYPSADSHDSMKNSWICYYKNVGKHHPTPSAELQDFQKLCDTEEHSSKKRIISHGLATCSQQVCAVDLYHGDFFDSMTEGTGQNYVNEDSGKPNLKSRVKKMKSA